MEWFANQRLATKIMVAPVFVLVLLVVAGIVVHGALREVDTQTKLITRDLAPDAGTATRLMDKVYQLRLAVKDYVKHGDEESAKKFRQLYGEMLKIQETARRDIQNPERAKMLEEMEQLSTEYNRAFNEVVVVNMNKRNQLVSGILDVKGPFVEKSLTQIMESAYRDGDRDAAFYSGELETHLLLARLYAVKFLVANKQADQQRVELEFATVEKSFNNLLTKLQNPARYQLAQDAHTAMGEYQRAFADVVKAIDTRNDAITNILNKSGPVMAQRAIDLQESVFKSLAEKSDEVESSINSTLILVISATIVAVILGVLIAMAVTRSITAPLARAVEAVNRVARGDLSVKLEVQSNDEVGQLSKAVQAMADNLRDIVTNIHAGTNQISNSSQQLSAVTEQSREGMNRQRVETEQVATAMNEMSATAHEVAQNAEQAAQAASEADKESSTGSKVVMATISAIKELAGDVEQSANVVESLKERSEGIGSVLDVIKGIAEQTNLLALNAAIEAARAGEQGRGFAVVADEVRTLAQRTQESTAEIEAMIEALQGGAKSAVDVMVRSRTNAQATVGQAEQAEESLQSITRAVATISEMNEQIASAASEQTSVAEDISKSVVSIQNEAEQSAAGADQIASSSIALSQLGDNLQQLVAQFKV